MRKRRKNKKAQIISGLVGGIAGLIILVIVSLLIVDTLNGAGLIASSTSTVLQSSINLTDATTSLTACAAAVDGVYSSGTLTNSTGFTIPTANYTIGDCTVANAYSGIYNSTTVNLTYTYSYDGTSQVSVDNMIINYTAGVDNVSEKLPTVLLIAAVVLLFGAIVFLVQRSRSITATQGGSI